MTVFWDLFIHNCTFLNVAHNAYTYIFMEKEQNVHIDGLTFDKVTGSSLNPLNAFILTSMKSNSNFVVKNL